MVERGSGASHERAVNAPQDQDMSHQNKKMRGGGVRKKRRRLTSNRQLIDRYVNQTSLSEWARNLVANERRLHISSPQERAVDVIRMPDQGERLEYSQAGSSSAGVGRGAGLGIAPATIGETEDQVKWWQWVQRGRVPAL